LILLVVRGFNTNAETNLILDENDIPKMGFSKFMNNVVKEWHLGKREEPAIQKTLATNLRLKI